MKKLIYLIMAVWAFTSCNDSDEAFTVEISAEGFHFTPIMGGLPFHRLSSGLRLRSGRQG